MGTALAAKSSRSILSNQDIANTFLNTLVEAEGNISKACEVAGISRSLVYRERSRSKEFSMRMEQAQLFGARERAHRLARKADEHIEMHLDTGWEYQTDENGEYVLDDNFERIKVSSVSLRDLTNARREMRSSVDGSGGGSVTNVSINTMNSEPLNIITSDMADDFDVVIIGPDGDLLEGDTIFGPCTKQGLESLKPKIIFEVCDPDGCTNLLGVRVRTAPGVGEGSLYDEMSKGIMTPLKSEEDRQEILKIMENKETRDFVLGLPVAQAIPAEPLE